VQTSLEACGLEVSGKRESEEMLEYKVQGDPHPTHPLVKVDVVRDTEPTFAPAEAHGTIRVDALLSIAVNKVATIFSRGWEVKDYVDLYFILKTKPFDLDALLPLAGQKGLGFDELQFAANLARVSTLQGLMPYLQRYMAQPLRADELVRFCEEAAAGILDRHPSRR
jgi:hypothetical protein